jgi:hypothetical protein
MRYLLGFGRLRDDRLEPRLRILDIGRDRTDHAEHLIIGVRIALLAQRDRHARGQRLRRQRTAFQEIATNHAARYRQHDIVEFAAGRFPDCLGARQRN